MAGLNRITTSMVMRNYGSNLRNSMVDLEKARQQVQTGMRISNSYEDPSAAAKAAILERRYLRNGDHTKTAENIRNWFDAQDGVSRDLIESSREIIKNYTVSAASDTNETERTTFANHFDSIQESMVLTLNSRYSNTYIMAGEDGGNAPFRIGDDGMLTYRGKRVTPKIDTTLNSAESKEQIINQLNQMEELSNERTFVDLGFGLFNDKGNVTDATALNVALPGTKLTGFGFTEDSVKIKRDESGKITDIENWDEIYANPSKAVANNIIDLTGKMSDILKEDNFDRNSYGECWDSFNKQFEKLTDNYTDLGTRENLVEKTLVRLKDEEQSIIKQFDTAVNVEPAEAITNMSWKMFAYNSALKVGTNIISPSLIDFLK